MLNVMIVDDEEIFADFLVDLLDQLGCTSSKFNCSLEALKNFIQDPDKFDLVISDLLMPKLTGNHLAEKMLSIKPETPIVLCSGYAGTLNLDSLLEKDNVSFFDKPDIKHNILEIVDRLRLC